MASGEETNLPRVIESLGGGWRVEGRFALRGDDRFAYVPGGWLRRGFSPDEVLGLCRARKRSPLASDCNWREHIAQARPTRSVLVSPLLVAVHPEVEWQDGDRLPTEAELEWILRDRGRRSWVVTDQAVNTRNRWKLKWDAPFGLEELIGEPQESSDSWTEGPHAGQPVSREVHVSWQDDDEEIIALHAAYRGWGRGVRRAVVALDNGAGDALDEAPTTDSGASELRAALAGSAKEAKLAWYAMELLRGSPAGDCFPLIEALIRSVGDSELAPKEAARALEWLGAMGWGPREAALRLNREDPVTTRIAQLSEKLVDALSHPKGPVRASAMLPLTLGSASTLDRVEAHLAVEKDAKVAANGLVGLALAGRPSPPTLPKLDKKLHAARTFAAALSGAAELDALLDSMKDPVVAKLLWFEGSPSRAATIKALESADDVATPALRVLDAGGHRGAIRDAVFGPLDPGPHRLLNPATLTEAQRALLARLLNRSFPIPGTRRSPLCRTMLLGEATDSPFATTVELDGERMPLYFALHELFAREQDGASDDREAQVEALTELTIDSLLALNREAYKVAQGDLVHRPMSAWDPAPPSPWPYGGQRLLRRIRRFPPSEREPFAAATADEYPRHE